MTEKAFRRKFPFELVATNLPEVYTTPVLPNDLDPKNENRIAILWNTSEATEGWSIPVSWVPDHARSQVPRDLRCRTKRFQFEANVLSQANWGETKNNLFTIELRSRERR